MKERKVIIPDYEVSLGKDRPFKVRIEGFVVVIGNVELVTPGDDSDIDNALLKYEYELESGEYTDDINEEKLTSWLNPIVSGELTEYINKNKS